MGRVVQSVAMSYVRGCFVRGLVAVYVVGVFVACFLIPLGRMSRTVGSDGTEIFLPFGIGAFLLMVLPALVAYAVARSRNATFDRMFGLLGLAGSPYAVQYRRYEGVYGGRRLQGLTASTSTARTRPGFAASSPNPASRRSSRGS